LEKGEVKIFNYFYMNFSIILAVDSKNGLGKENNLAWKLSGDMKYFKKTTVLTEKPDDINVVIM
jgi:dihydrofolate reductase